jgi:hypothetical protein
MKKIKVKQRVKMHLKKIKGKCTKRIKENEKQ